MLPDQPRHPYAPADNRHIVEQAPGATNPARDEDHASTVDSKPTRLRPHVGIFHFTGDMRPFTSVEYVWRKVIGALADTSRVTVHTSAELDLRESMSAAQLLAEVDVGVMLSPYQRLPVDRQTPLVIFALGSLYKGAPWLALAKDQLTTIDTVVVSSTTCRRILAEILTTPRPAVEHLPFPIDERTFKRADGPGNARDEIGVEAGTELLVYAGRLSLQKNIHSVVDLLRDLRARGRDACLVLAGHFDDFHIQECGPLPDRSFEEVLTQHIAELGLSPHVRLLPHLEHGDLAELFRAADLGVSLSTFPNENFGLTIVEMQACGLPVLVTDWGGQRDTSRHGRTAFHVPTMLSENGPRLSRGAVLRSAERALSDADLRRMVGWAAGSWAARFGTSHFAQALRRVIESAATRARALVRCPAGLRRTWLDAAQETLDTGADTRWTHLDALRQPELYRSILGPAATFSHNDVRWLSQDSPHQAFAWTVDASGQLWSTDPRWGPSLNRIQRELTGDARAMAVRLARLGSVRPWESTRGVKNPRESLLCLAEKGLVMPNWSMRRAQRATQAAQK